MTDRHWHRSPFPTHILERQDVDCYGNRFDTAAPPPPPAFSQTLVNHPTNISYGDAPCRSHKKEMIPQRRMIKPDQRSWTSPERAPAHGAVCRRKTRSSHLLLILITSRKDSYKTTHMSNGEANVAFLWMEWMGLQIVTWISNEPASFHLAFCEYWENRQPPHEMTLL